MDRHEKMPLLDGRTTAQIQVVASGGLSKVTKVRRGRSKSKDTKATKGTQSYWPVLETSKATKDTKEQLWPVLETSERPPGATTWI